MAATIERYIAVRDEINAGKRPWADLAQFFTDDAVFIDPAWGRVQGIDEMKRTVFGDAMVGFEEWQFPTEFYAIDGDNVRRQVEADPARDSATTAGPTSSRACRR